MTINIAGDIAGLSTSEVEERVRRGERNRFSLRPTRTYSQIIWANVFSLYNIILLGAFLVLLLIRGPGSSIFPAAIVIINMVLGLIQEIRAKRALDQLATLSAHTVTVRRDAKSHVIPIQEIVQDEVIELHPGDSIVVDGTILSSDGLEIDESQLTGESEYVEKQQGEKVTSGSFCIAGFGLMKAEHVGASSYVNHLANVARAYKNVRTPLEQQLDVLVKLLVGVMIIVAPLTLLGGSARGTPLADSFENVVNLMSSLVPQGLLVFVAISFAYGVVSISRFRALIQRPNAVELMGHVTCLCADKTGTLTQNRLSVMEIMPASGQDAQSVRDRLSAYVTNVSWHNRTVSAIAASVDGKPTRESSKRSEVPFNSERKWSSVTLNTGETLVLGAPEVVLADEAMKAEAGRLGKQGLRSVAFAASGESPVKEGKSLPADLKPLALITLQDELRPDIRETLQQFAEEHIAIKIISGDSPETIRSIAQQAGMAEAKVITGRELEGMDPAQLDQEARATDLFARITPDAKRRLIVSLAKDGPVAMIGDGVNDVPALKQASLAIAMNDGAQIAKDVSDIILLNNAFSTLPRAFFEGREITQRLYGIAKINLVKVVYLTILFVLAGYSGLPWPASLLQTTWLSFVTLTAPAMLIIFRVLPVPPGENRVAQVVRYILTWGVVGAVGLLLLDVLSIEVFKDSLPVSRVMIIAFAGLYNSLILWDIYHVRPFQPRSFLQHPGAAIAGAVLGMIAAFAPAYLFPRALGFAPMGLRELAVLGATLCLASLAVWLLRMRVTPEKLHLRRQG
jgi:cation-transporting P-type ATPase E